ncbi:hypothetical protein [Nonomuraea aurantiaca]|uniref:hypothetical protein n=1 Tax=Nonomuraea aurantiaca TaxID=2878562 RepID=UPI001CD968B2|nr:hypothetical protein [Nonomuraea aurantiaca]MCA2222940.1 hypothetical protein [Nonomuraea aurantiaca]
MDLRNDHERLDERLDEFAEAPSPRPGPVDTHDNDAQPATPSDQLVFDQSVQLPPATESPTPAVSLLGSDPVDVRARWHDLQASFVDDPREAVQRADSLLDEVAASLCQALESRISELQYLWKNTAHSDTEQLRMALRSYRDVMHRLLPFAEEPATR